MRWKTDSAERTGYTERLTVSRDQSSSMNKEGRENKAARRTKDGG